MTREQTEISRLTTEAYELKEQLRAERTLRDELTVLLHNQQPRRILKRKLHSALDFVQRITPAPVRDLFRPSYLRLYRRVFPHGSREFGSADLIKSRESTIAPPVARTSKPAEGTGSPSSSRAPTAGFESFLTYRPLVSVVLPVWNQPEFLGESIRSVLSQSYERIELIVVDDGSTVDLSAGLEEFRQDTRLRTIRKKHAGIAPALNAGFRVANGEFLTWTSADNVMHREAVGTLVDFLLRHPATGMVYANIELMDEHGQPLVGSEVRVINQRAHASHILDLPESIETLALAEDNFIGACFLYRGSAARIVGEYDDSRLGTEDYDYWLRMSMAAAIRHLDSNECLYRYRVHGKSLTSKYGRTVVAENISDLLLNQRERKVCLGRPFDVDVLYDGVPAVPVETVAAIVAALQQQGHRVTVYATPVAGEGSRELPFIDALPLPRAWFPSVPDEEHRDEENRHVLRKRILLSFVDSELLEAKGLSFAGNSTLCFQWLPPEARLDKWPDIPASSWLLCGSAECLNRLPEGQRRRASLLIPSKVAYQQESFLFLKARDNSYPVAEIPQLEKPLALYVGSTEKTFLDADILLDTAERYREVQFVVIENNGDEPPASPSNAVKAMNILYLQGKSPSGRLAYLSQASLLLAPLRAGHGRLGEMQDLCHLYLLAGKPILATDAVRSGGFEDMPNACIVRPGAFAETLPAVLKIQPNLAIADEYRLSRSADQIARNLINIANSRLLSQRSATDAADDDLRQTAQPG